MLELRQEVKVQTEPIAAGCSAADLDPLASAVCFLQREDNDLHRSAFHISTDDGVRETTTANAKGLINQLLEIIKGCDSFSFLFLTAQGKWNKPQKATEAETTVRQKNIVTC